MFKFLNLTRHYREYRLYNRNRHSLLFFCADVLVVGFQVCLLALPALLIMTAPNQAELAKSTSKNSVASVITTEEFTKAVIVPASLNPIQKKATEYPALELDKNDGLWVEPDKDSFTIQLGSSSDKKQLLDQARALPQRNNEPVFIYPYKTTRSGKTVYGLSLGEFDSLELAFQASQKLAPEVRKFGVWVRPLAELQLPEIELAR